ncbi:MAG: ATP-binding cassette domain-containing protein, partial [candidate division WOR-3 bacterium]
MNPVLEIRGLTKAFGGLIAVKDFALRLQEGSLTGLIGPNGAGKTTVFNLITGMVAPSSGSISFQGKEITKMKPYQIYQL